MPNKIENRYKQLSYDKSEICELVRRQEQQYISSGNDLISKYVSFDLWENNNKIEAYLNSKNTSGDKDSLGRDKPFFNIVRAARNIWYRATDLDRKNFVIKSPHSKDFIASFLATAKLHEYMNRENFGQFLNDWGLSLATYGSSVLKFIQQGDRLHTMVIPWNRLIIDPIDFNKAPVIEILELTESELRKNKYYNPDIVDSLCEATHSRELMDKTKKDTRNNYFRLYEIHGEMPLSYLTGNEEDENNFVQQMHVISFVAGKNSGEFDDYTLVSGREAKSPYMITHLMKEDGRATGMGAVESLFEEQWMVNHSQKLIKDQLDLASKLIFQTSDGNFVGQNALTAIQTGDIMIHAVNEPLTQLQNNSHDIGSIQSFGNQWKVLGNEITGISESMLGNNPPSGTAWRQTEALLQESHSLFQLMTQNKGLYAEQMLRDFIIPYIKTQLDTTDEVRVVLSDYGIDKINALHIKAEVARINNKIVKDTLLSGQPVVGQDLNALEAMVQGKMNEQGGNRFLSPSDLPDVTWKEVFKDFEWEAECEITGENNDKQAALTTLNTTLQLVLSKQGAPFTPTEQLIFNKILNLTGEVSVSELEAIKSSSQTSPQSPATAPIAPPVGA